MSPELAEHISRLAAPIYAALLMRNRGSSFDEVLMRALRAQAIQHAMDLWRETVALEIEEMPQRR